MFEGIRDWVIGKFLDWFIEPLKKVNINYEKLLRILGIALIVIPFITFFSSLVNDSLSICIGPIIEQKSGNTTLEPIFEHKLMPTIAVILSFMDIVIWCLYVLLKIEKKNNAATYKRNMRSEVARSIKAPNVLLAFSDQNDKCLIEPEKWASIESNKEALVQYRDHLVSEYCKICDEFCEKVWVYIAPHIRAVNADDTVNISVKLFFDKDNGEKNVLNLGKALSSGDMRDLKHNVRPHSNNWDFLLSSSYKVEEDYAMSFIMKEQYCKSIFRCGNISAYREKLNDVCSMESSPRMRYRIPSSVVRPFDATLVNPILIRTGPTLNSYKIAGALCIDTTNSYSDWDQPGSYEETLVALAVSCISPILLHSMEDLEKVNSALNNVA